MNNINKMYLHILFFSFTVGFDINAAGIPRDPEEHEVRKNRDINQTPEKRATQDNKEYDNEAHSRPKERVTADEKPNKNEAPSTPEKTVTAKPLKGNQVHSSRNQDTVSTHQEGSGGHPEDPTGPSNMKEKPHAGNPDDNFIKNLLGLLGLLKNVSDLTPEKISSIIKQITTIIKNFTIGGDSKLDNLIKEILHLLDHLDPSGNKHRKDIDNLFEKLNQLVSVQENHENTSAPSTSPTSPRIK